MLVKSSLFFPELRCVLCTQDLSRQISNGLWYEHNRKIDNHEKVIHIIMHSIFYCVTS